MFFPTFSEKTSGTTRSSVIPRSAKRDVGIPILRRRLPHQCEHWFAMTGCMVPEEEKSEIDPLQLLAAVLNQ